MSDPLGSNIHVRAIRLSGWRAAVAVVIGLSVLVALAALLTLGFLFVVLPAAVVGAVAYYLLPKRNIATLRHPKATEQSNSPNIIEGSYRRIENGAEDREAGTDHK